MQSPTHIEELIIMLTLKIIYKITDKQNCGLYTFYFMEDAIHLKNLLVQSVELCLSLLV